MIHRLMFENYKDSLFNDKIILKWQLRFKSNHHDIYREEVNKIALSSNDDKRLIEWQHIYKEKLLLKYVKVKCWVNINDELWWLH